MKRRLLLALLVAGLALRGRADTLTFTNGDHLTGRLLRATAMGCVFHSAMDGDLTVPWGHIRQLRTSRNFVVITNRNTVRRGRLRASASRIRIVRTAPSPRASVAVADLRLIVDPATFRRSLATRIEPWQGWQGEVNGGFSQVEATQTSVSVTASVHLRRPQPALAWLPQRSNTVVHFDASYGRLASPTTPTVRTSIVTGGVEQDQDVSANLFVFADAEFDHNLAQGLALQQAYGGGLGWKLLQSPAVRLALKADLHWTRQRFLAPPRQQFLASSFSESLREHYPLFVWRESFRLTPSYTSGLAYQMAGLSSWAVPVYHALGFQFTVADSYLNNPQPGYLKNTLQVSTGLQYTMP